MRKIVKILALVLAVALAVSLAACGSSNTGSNAQSTSSAAAAQSTSAADSKATETSKFVRLSYVMLGDPPTNGQLEKVQAKWNEIFKSKINAELTLKWVEWADWYTKYNLLLASGEPLDLITTASDWLDLWPNAQKGAFMNLDDLLPKYAPKTWEEVPKEDWEQSKYNGKIVTIPEDHYTQWVNHGIFYRGDWAKEFGITEPIKDWETMGKYFQGIKDKKPGVIPWDVNGTKNEATDGWVISHTDAVALDMVPTGFLKVFWGKSYNEKYTAWSPIFDQTYVDYAKMMKEWGDKGYWREDVLNYKGDTRAELKAGKSGADQHHTQTYRGLRYDMDKAQPGSELQMFAFADTRNNLISMPVTHGGTSIGAHSQNPERALMAYELIRQDQEVYRLFNWGMEGVQYVIKDGKLTSPDGYDDKRDGFYTDFWGGRMDKFELPSTTEYPGIYDIFKKYDSIKKPYPYGRFVFNKQPIEAELAAISDVTNQLGAAIAYGKAGDPVKAVDTLRSKLKAAGYDKVLAEVQKQLDAYKAVVEGK